MDDGMAHADALRDALLETVATKADLADARNDLKAEIGGVRSEISDVRSEIGDARSDTDSLRSELRELRTEMHSEFKAVRLEIRLSQRDLMMKGAAALVVVASVLIGVKFLG